MNHDQIINKILPLIWKVITRVQACWLNIYVLLAAQMLSDFLVNTLSIEATREQRVGLNDKRTKGFIFKGYILYEKSGD